MHKRHPKVRLAKWHIFPADSLTQAYITPYIARLRVRAEPEHLDIATRVVNYFHSAESGWQMPQEEPTCYALRLMTQRTGYWELREGALLNFNDKAFARLISLGRPYWRNLKSPSISDDPSPDTGNYLLSYLGLEFLNLAELDEFEREHAHLLMPADHLFD